jgi:glycosyltransferase involved in cell wall biosynthesis
VLPRFDARELDEKFDAVIGVGAESLLLLALLKRAARIWYAADELVLACLSQGWSRALRFRALLTNWLIERSMGGFADAIWVVSDREKRWMRVASGHRRITVVPNGVDTSYFAPISVDHGRRIVFWGRLDFPPNIKAIEWFLDRVWPGVRARAPGASFRVIGACPTQRVREVTREEGVELCADVPDLRGLVCEAPIAVFPFFHGAGLKNKVLEGAAMGRALIMSSRAAQGLCRSEDAALVVNRPVDWIDSIVQLLHDEQRALQLGATARNWVERHHSWASAAKTAEQSITFTHPCCTRLTRAELPARG